MRQQGFDPKTGQPIYAHEVTPTQVDVGAKVINLMDKKQGEVVLTTGSVAHVKFDDGVKELHFGRLAPGPGAVGE